MTDNTASLNPLQVRSLFRHLTSFPDYYPVDNLVPVTLPSYSVVALIPRRAYHDDPESDYRTAVIRPDALSAGYPG